jgi:hypothetical protein
VSARLAIALVHHPVLDAQGAVVTSTLTNIDVHDLARSAKTYGCSDFFVVHPIEAQRTLAARILEHWTTGSSAKRIPDRKDALSLVRIVNTLPEAKTALGANVRVWVTAAREIGTSLSWRDARSSLDAEDDVRPVLLVFGTSWGLAPDVTSSADAVLAPIDGGAGWNHLSVRAACAIALDRLRR